MPAEEVNVDVRELLVDLYGRIPEHVRGAVEGLSAEELATAPELGSNPIGWLIWHLTRVQDDHIAELLEADQIWVTGTWHARLGLDRADPADTGYGHSPAQVARVRPEGPEALIDYYDAVAARTDEFIERLTSAELDRVVDQRWDPPVTVGVRLISVADDDIQHAGQAAYLRGLLSRRAR